MDDLHPFSCGCDKCNPRPRWPGYGTIAVWFFLAAVGVFVGWIFMASTPS